MNPNLSTILFNSVREQQATRNCLPNQMRGVDGRCGPGVGLGITRDQMPQIRSKDFIAFLQYVNLKSISIRYGWAKAKDLKPVQSEFRQDRVDSITGEALGLAVLISEDNRVLDGNHRWIKHRQISPDDEVPTITIGAPVMEALELMHDFPNVEYATNSNP